MSLVIVTSHWKEDLEWLKKSKWPVVLIDKEGSDPSWLTPQHVIPNKGQEASVYLKYIIENYDNLPDHVAFIHGHENAWHQFHDKPLLEMIGHANIHSHEFISLNNFMKLYPFVDEGTEYMKIETLWDAYNITRPKPPSAFLLQSPIGAQFIVSKKRILQIAKEDYQRWYTMIQEPSYEKSARIATFFELVWHIIFGEPWVCKFPKSWFNVDTIQETWYHDRCEEVHNIQYYINWRTLTAGFTDTLRMLTHYF